jgi:hypothetical protein
MSALTEQELHPRVNSMTVDRGRGRGNRPHRHESILIGVALQSTAPGLGRRDPTLDLREMESFFEPTPDLAWVLAA